MDNNRKVFPLLAKRKATEQTAPFLEYYQQDYRRLVAIDKRRGKIFAVSYSPEKMEELQHADMYYPLNVVADDFTGTKVKKADIVGLRAWAADIDPHPENVAEPDPELFARYNLRVLLRTKDTKLLHQQAYILQEIVHPVVIGQRGMQPSLLVFSGRGFQLLWYADKTYPADSPKEIRAWEGIGRAIIATIGGDAVQNVDRILRLPGTVNFKTGMTSRITWETGSTYTPEQMTNAFGTSPKSIDSTHKGVDPAEFKYVDWKAVFNTSEILDLDDDLIERFEEDRARYKDLNSVYSGNHLPGQRDTSGSGFDIALIGRLKRFGYEPQDAFQIAMTYDYGSGHRYAADNEPRYFMRCWARSPGDKPTTPEEDFADIPIPKEDPDKPKLTHRNTTNAYNEICENYLYVAMVNKVIHVESGSYFDLRGFDEKYVVTHPGGKDNPPKAHHVLIEQGRQVDSITWDPTRDLVFKDTKLNYYNMYRKNRKPVVNYTPGCTKLFHEALEWVVPNKFQREVVLDHFAFTAQHPERKINWHLLFFSVMEGVGKDTVLEAIRHASGAANTSETTLKELTGNFNATLRYKKTVIINEVESFERGKEISNQLKVLLAAPPNTIEINAKYEPQFNQPNLFSVYMTSNKTRPIHVAKADRRLLPIQCREEMMPDELAGKVWDWYLEEGGLDLVYHELLNRDLSDFNPSARPKSDAVMADHKKMQELSKSHSEVLIEEMIDNEEGVFDRDIVLRSKLMEFADRKRMPITTVEEALRTAGGVQFSRVSVKTDDGKTRKYTMWVVRNQDKYLIQKGSYVGKKRNHVSYRDFYDVATGITDFDDLYEEEDIL